MAELGSETWGEIAIDGTTIECTIRPADAKCQIANRYGSRDDRGHIFLLTDDTVTYSCRPINPGSTDRATSGQAVYADWREYGQSTGSEVQVVNANGTELFSKEFGSSSPFVTIDNSGEYVAVSPYDGKTRVFDVESGRLVTLHENILTERQKVLFVGDGPELRFGPNKNNDPMYGITLEDKIVWKTDEFKEHHLVSALPLTADTYWPDAIQELKSNYQSGDEALHRRINETFLESSLARITDEQRLRDIIAVLEDYQAITESDEDRRAVCIPLADAYDRLAKEIMRDGGNPEFWETLDTAIEYANDGLPWYPAKRLLAKSYRRKARAHKIRNQHQDANRCIQQIFDLEEEYDIQLATDADLKLKNELVR